MPIPPYHTTRSLFPFFPERREREREAIKVVEAEAEGRGRRQIRNGGSAGRSLLAISGRALCFSFSLFTVASNRIAPFPCSSCSLAVFFLYSREEILASRRRGVFPFSPFLHFDASSASLIGGTKCTFSVPSLSFPQYFASSPVDLWYLNGGKSHDMCDVEGSRTSVVRTV